MINIEQFGKGGKTQAVDLRDYRLEAIPGAVLLPSNFEIIFGGKIKHQNGSSSCVSQATTYHAEILNFKETGEWVELSPHFIYPFVHLQGGGSYTKDNMAYVCDNGIATEQDCPSYMPNSVPPSEVWMEDGSNITQQAKDNAYTYLSKKYVTWDNQNVDMFKQAIYNGNGCVICSWGNNYCWQNAQILLPDNRTQMSWQHGVCLVGWDDATKNFKFINSWGTQWGQGGYGYLPYSYIENGYVSNPCVWPIILDPEHY